MAIVSRAQIKEWFQNLKKPTEAHFAAWIDSFFHKTDKIPQSSIEDWDEFLNNIPAPGWDENMLLTDMSNLRSDLSEMQQEEIKEKLDLMNLGIKFAISPTWSELPIDPKNGDIFELTTNDLPIPSNVQGADPVETAGKYKFNGAVWVAKSNELLYEEMLAMLVTKEDAANKSGDIEGNQASMTKFPTIKAVYDWVINKLTGKLNIRMDNLPGNLSESERTTIKTRLGLTSNSYANRNLSNVVYEDSASFTDSVMMSAISSNYARKKFLQFFYHFPLFTISSTAKTAEMVEVVRTGFNTFLLIADAGGGGIQISMSEAGHPFNANRIVQGLYLGDNQTTQVVKVIDMEGQKDYDIYLRTMYPDGSFGSWGGPYYVAEFDRGLSDNNFTNALKQKLDSLSNYDDGDIYNALENKADRDFKNAIYQTKTEEFTDVILVNPTTKEIARTTIDELLAPLQNKLDILVPPPTYTLPTASLNLSNKTLEVGTTMSESMTVSFNQNDAGDVVDFKVWKNGIEVSQTNSYTETGILEKETIIYQGEVSYEAGEIKNNIFDEPDDRGAITAGSVTSPNRTIRGEFRIFFGFGDKVENMRTLPQNAFESANNLILNTGTTEREFYVAVPDYMTLNSVVDLDALNAEIGSQYIETTGQVADASGTLQNYKIYTMTIDSAYSANHRHRLTFN